MTAHRLTPTVPAVTAQTLPLSPVELGLDTAGPAVLLRRALAAIEAHDCRSPWREPERVEGRLVVAALGARGAGRRSAVGGLKGDKNRFV